MHPILSAAGVLLPSFRGHLQPRHRIGLITPDERRRITIITSSPTKPSLQSSCRLLLKRKIKKRSCRQGKKASKQKKRSREWQASLEDEGERQTIKQTHVTEVTHPSGRHNQQLTTQKTSQEMYQETSQENHLGHNPKQENTKTTYTEPCLKQKTD